MLPGWFSGIILGILGLCVGVFIDIIIRHHDLKHKHYFFAIFFVTLLAVFSIVSIFTIVKPIIATKNLYITENPIFLLTFYIVGNIIPHIMWKKAELSQV